VVADGDDQVVVLDARLQAYHGMWVVGWLGVFHHVGQGLLDGQGEVITRSAAASCVCSHCRKCARRRRALSGLASAVKSNRCLAAMVSLPICVGSRTETAQTMVATLCDLSSPY
jgi:hypothetical protein